MTDNADREPTNPQKSNGIDDCDTEALRKYSSKQTILNNVPYSAMVLLGAAILAIAMKGPLAAFAAAALVIYGAIGTVWIMHFVCPYCRYWDTRSCPCGYGIVSAKLRKRQDYDRFNEKFKKHIPVIVPLWFIPLVPGIYNLIRTFSWPMLVLITLFAIDAFIILPMFSKKHGCAECPQKDTCPWMAGKTKEDKTTPQATTTA